MEGSYLPAVTGALFGGVLGSFIVTLVLRWPHARSIVHGRSRCDSCGTQISASSLVPVISYVIQRGRARCCQAPIHALHPIGEISSIIIGAFAFHLLGWNGWPGAIFGWILLTLALIDLRYFILPDWLTTLLALVGIASAAVLSIPSLPDRMIGMIAGYGALAIIRLGYRYLRGQEGLGGGDPKLLGAIGAWVGWQPLPTILLIAAMTGLAVAIAMKILDRPIAATTRLPLGTLMAISAWPVWMSLQLTG